jgi:hypothetical protein
MKETRKIEFGIRCKSNQPKENTVAMAIEKSVITRILCTNK